MSKPQIIDGFEFDAKGNFNDKPMSHWDAKSDELVIRCLLDAANLDTRSIVGAKASQRLMNLAMAISPSLVHKLTADSERYKINVAAAINSMTGQD